MGLMEIVLIIIGVAAFALGFLLPSDKRGNSQNTVRIDEEDIRNVVEKEVENAKSQISDIVDETITYAMEKTERSMDRLTNEKMLAVNEYSDTVLSEINKNHKEVVFLYDMLNDKHDSLKATVSEAIKADSEIKQASRDAEVTAREMQEKVREVQESVDEAMSSTRLLKESIENRDSFAERQSRTETFASDKVEESDGFTPITANEVEVVIPSPEVSVLGTENLEKPQNTEENGQSLDEAGTDEGKNNNERILQLHKAGKSNMAIARELGLGIGEVKLVIDLFEGS